MSNPLTAQVIAQYGQDKLKPSIQITPHPGLYVGDQGIPLRCYPPGCQLVASVGTITLGNIYQVEIPGEMIKFSGSDYNLKFYPITRPDLTFITGFDERGNLLSSGQIQLTTNLTTGVVHSSKSFQGLVKAGVYQSQYQLFYYKPEITIQNIHTSDFPAYPSEYGSVCAYKDGTIEIYDIPTLTNADGPQKVEIYRITSTTIADPDGLWEKPVTSKQSGYNQSTAFPGSGSPSGPDPNNSADQQRVHEVGYLTTSSVGALWYDRFSNFLQKPFDAPTLIRGLIVIGGTNTSPASGTPLFQPVLEFKAQTPASLFPSNSYLSGAAAREISNRREKLWIDSV